MSISIVSEPGPFRKSCIYIDGELHRRVSHAIIPLKVCMALQNEPTFHEALKEVEYTGAYSFALRALAKQMLHSCQLSRKLRRHFVEETTIQRVIEKLCQQGFLCDDQVVSSLSEKWERQGKSQRETCARCRRMGMPSLHKPLDEKKSLTQLISKKYPELLNPDLPYLDRCKAVRALSRRGFSYDLVLEVLNRL